MFLVFPRGDEDGRDDQAVIQFVIRLGIRLILPLAMAVGGRTANEKHFEWFVPRLGCVAANVAQTVVHPVWVRKDFCFSEFKDGVVCKHRWIVHKGHFILFRVQVSGVASGAYRLLHSLVSLFLKDGNRMHARHQTFEKGNAIKRYKLITVFQKNVVPVLKVFFGRKRPNTVEERDGRELSGHSSCSEQ